MNAISITNLIKSEVAYCLKEFVFSCSVAVYCEPKYLPEDRIGEIEIAVTGNVGLSKMRESEM